MCAGIARRQVRRISTDSVARPVVDHRLEEVGVAAVLHVVEETAGDHAAARRNTGRGQQFVGAGHDVGLG